jgi:ABC-type uncharacterized transport system permease subunit
MDNPTKPRWRLVKTDQTSFWIRPLIPIIILALTFAITSGLILLADVNPLNAYYYFLFAPFESRTSILEILVKSTPLILTGVSVTFAFVSGYYNIGAEGQLYAGAIAAAGLGTIMWGVPAIIAIPIMIIGGFLAGMAWAFIPAILKTRLAVDEVVTTLLMNSIMAYVVSALLNGPWRDPNSGWPQSPDIAPTAVFFKLVPRSRLNFGFIVALVSIIILWLVLNKTSFGLRMKAVGLGKSAAIFAGIKVNRTVMTAALISGGIAGLAGVAEVAGIHFHLIGEISPGYGYTGVIVATLGSLNAFGVGLAAIFFGLIETGAQTLSRELGVPVYLGEVTQAVMLLVTLGVLLLQRYRFRRL